MAKINIHKQYLTVRELDNLNMDELLEIVPQQTYNCQSFGIKLMPAYVDNKRKWSACYYTHFDNTVNATYGTIYHDDPAQCLRNLIAALMTSGVKIEIPKHWSDGESIGKVPRPVQFKIRKWSLAKATTEVGTEAPAIRLIAVNLLMEGAVMGWRYRCPEINRLNKKIAEQKKQLEETEQERDQYRNAYINGDEQGDNY